MTVSWDLGRRRLATPDVPWRPGSWDVVSVVTVYVVLLLAVPSRLAFAPLGGEGTPAAVLGSVLLLWWLAGWVLSPFRPTMTARPLRIALALMTAAVLVSYVVASTRLVDPAELRSADRGLITLTALLGVALLVADGVPNERRLEILLRRLVVGTSCLAVVGMLQYFTGFDLARHIAVPGLTATGELGGIGQRSALRRVAATAIHPIEYGVVLAAVLPLALHFALHARPGRRARWWGAVALIGVAMPMSVSRSAFVGFAAASLVLLRGWNRSRRLGFLLCAPLFVVGVRLLAPGLVGTIRSLFLSIGSDASTTGRASRAGSVGHYLSTAPFFGRGFMTFTPVLYRLLDDEYLKLLVEVGLVGTLAVAGVFVTAMVCGHTARTASADPDTRDLGLSLAACVVVPGVAFITFDAFSFPLIIGLTFLLVGSCGALWRIGRESDAGE